MAETDFSDWLFENVDLLTEALDLDEIQPFSREDNIGRFRVDIFGEETSTGRKVVIENQYESSDHDHLGKIITYAAGKDADIIIWVVENALEEHASAIEWLNLNTGSNKGYFLVEIELWRIEDSLPAPRFNIIEKPNTWIQAERAEMDAASKMKLSFWRQFVEYSSTNGKMRKAYPGINTRKGGDDHWFTLSKGCKGNYHINCLVFTNGGKVEAIGMEVWIADDKDLFLKLEAHKSEIESEFGFEVTWDYKEDRKASNIRIKKEVDPDDTDYSNYFEWLADKAITMRDVINRYV